MPTLAEKLSVTAPVSPLLRKARRLGIHGVDELIALAAARGCHHYAPSQKKFSSTQKFDVISDNELTILLLLGENAYEPNAIRAAAQLARSPQTDADALAKLAMMGKCEAVLAHIARAGIEHDAEGQDFWKRLLDQLPPVPDPHHPALPHWTRFVSMPGIQRHGTQPTRWLTPTR